MAMIDVILLCDQVGLQDGKLYIHGGGWTQIGLPVFPTEVDLQMAIRLVGNWEDSARAASGIVRFDVIDADGHSVVQGAPPGGGFMRYTLDRGIIPPGHQAPMFLALTLRRALLSEPGASELRAYLDDQPAFVVPFRAERAEQRTTGASTLRIE